MMAKDPDWVAACHEAGHSVAAHLLGVETEFVGIRGSGSGKGRWTAAEKFNRERMEGIWQDYTIVAEMGRRVEVMLFGQYEARFLEADDESIDRYLLTFLTTEEERLAFRKRLPRMAEEVAQRPYFLDAVVSLAHELMKGMLVDGEHARAIIHDALVPG